MANRASTLVKSLLLLSILSLLFASVEGKHNVRMVRAVRRATGNDNAKAAPADSSLDPFSIENIGANPTATQDTSTATGTAKGGKATATDATVTGTGNTGTPAATAPAGQETSTDSGLLNGLTSLLPIPSLNLTSPTNTTTSTSSSISTTTSSSATTTSSTPTATQSVPTQLTQTIQSQVTITSTAPQESQTAATANVGDASGGASNSSSGHIARNTIIAIAAIGGSVALIALLWTVFRKWKLRPTDNFEERLNPIDWNPTSSDPVMAQRERKRASIGSNRSFGSADAHSTRGFINDIPNHDFTAGPRVPNSLAPGGGNGMYPEMTRGPSRGPYDTRPNGGGYGATQYGGY